MDLHVTFMTVLTEEVTEIGDSAIGLAVGGMAQSNQRLASCRLGT